MRQEEEGLREREAEGQRRAKHGKAVTEWLDEGRTREEDQNGRLGGTWQGRARGGSKRSVYIYIGGWVGNWATHKKRGKETK